MLKLADIVQSVLFHKYTCLVTGRLNHYNPCLQHIPQHHYFTQTAAEKTTEVAAAAHQPSDEG